MSRYDGLIIPRSYSEYINKTDAATLLQALQQSGVMDAAPTSGSNHPVKSDGLVPDDTISNSMKSVTSHAVNVALARKVSFVRYNTGAATEKSYTFSMSDTETIRVTASRESTKFSIYLFVYVGNIITYALLNSAGNPISNIQTSGSSVTLTCNYSYTNIIIERLK